MVVEISGAHEVITANIMGGIHLDKKCGSHDKELLNLFLVKN